MRESFRWFILFATGLRFATTAFAQVISTGNGPPVITTQPASRAVLQGEPFEFAVGASGVQPLIFQWYHNGVAIGGARSPTYASLTARYESGGRYSVTVQNSLGLATSAEAELRVLSVPRISNLSVRAPVGGAAGVLTIGFTVSRRNGPDQNVGGSVGMLLRGIGPALAGFGLPNALLDPQLSVYSGSTLVTENDDWPGTTQFANASNGVGAFPLSPGSQDAATIRTLPPGNHTVLISGKAGASGVVLGEIYDTTPDQSFYTFSPRLTNVSALSLSGPDADKLTAGFVIVGSAPRTVLVRAVGPGLAAVGIPTGILTDPRLALFDGRSNRIAENDNWGGTPGLRDAFAQVGAFSLAPDSRDAAVLAVLPPGSYSAEVSSADNATGIALIEIYELP